MDTKASAIKIFEQHYAQWESNENRMKDGYTYESSFVEMIRKVGIEVFQSSTGKVPKGKNGKKKSKRV